ncbi:phage antirepressor protein [Pseudomonas sp. PB101]|uniref:Rha family transcriptional regulator n=1 Tax=Pseudomonas sp. PB101 TaxID=2495428 RepID=UPI001365338E|nr:phage antirepressor KilAC domain-containing protein [Pseudomonas sp. PB101]MVW87735.1 phage antirepressor protein [Pseudomonas sp. PB101]
MQIITNVAPHQTANAVIMVSRSPFAHQFPGTSVDHSGITAAPLTMSSLEMAELTEKNHADVMRDIRNMLEDLGVEDASKFAGIYLDTYKREKPCFNLPRDLTETLITGYSAPLRYKVVVRLHELEAQAAKPPALALPNFSNPAEAARAWATEFEGRTLALEDLKARDAKITEDAPKIEVYHQIADSTGLIGFQKFCTQLNLKQKEVKHWMKDIGWLRARQYLINPLPTAFAVDNGYCKITNFTTDSGMLVQRIWFTGKAVTYASEKAPGYIRKNVA